MSGTSLTFRSHIQAPAGDLRAWHANPGAFQRLTPPWLDARVQAASGGIDPGDTVSLRVPVLGLLGFTWNLRHDALPDGDGFVDIQESGPFTAWRHEHRFIPTGEMTSVLEDHITYSTPAPAGRLIQSRLEDLFRFRHHRTRIDLARHTTTGFDAPLRIVVSGASGLVGSRLVPFLRAGGHTVHTLVRRQPASPEEIFWDPARGEIDADALEGVDAVIHLAGASIAGGLWTTKRKHLIRDSRVDSTTLLATTLARLHRKPAVFVSTSAVGFYGDGGATPLTEDAPGGEGFLADVVREWEAAARPAADAGIRVVHPRFGVVVAGDGGMVPLLRHVFRAGIGGRLGDGKQYMAWIALEDLLGILLESVANPDLEGPVNAVSPQELTNDAFTRLMGHVFRRPAIMRVPAFAMRLAAGQLADELILTSQRVIPDRLARAGFRFEYPSLESTLRHEFGRYRGFPDVDDAVRYISRPADADAVA